jgi:hypothetical protein
LETSGRRSTVGRNDAAGPRRFNHALCTRANWGGGFDWFGSEVVNAVHGCRWGTWRWRRRGGIKPKSYGVAATPAVPAKKEQRRKISGLRGEDAPPPAVRPTARHTKVRDVPNPKPNRAPALDFDAKLSVHFISFHPCGVE